MIKVEGEMRILPHIGSVLLISANVLIILLSFIWPDYSSYFLYGIYGMMAISLIWIKSRVPERVIEEMEMEEESIMGYRPPRPPMRPRPAISPSSSSSSSSSSSTPGSAVWVDTPDDRWADSPDIFQEPYVVNGVVQLPGTLIEQQREALIQAMRNATQPRPILILQPLPSGKREEDPVAKLLREEIRDLDLKKE